jgi:hypothetical protein
MYLLLFGELAAYAYFFLAGGQNAPFSLSAFGSIQTSSSVRP